MTRRPHCEAPAACAAKGEGHCRRCNFRRLHADPEFAVAHSERMRRLHADPEFAVAHSERSAERMHRLNADRRGFEVPAHLSDLYQLARRKGFRPKAALRFAEREIATRPAPQEGLAQ